MTANYILYIVHHIQCTCSNKNEHFGHFENPTDNKQQGLFSGLLHSVLFICALSGCLNAFCVYTL